MKAKYHTNVSKVISTTNFEKSRSVTPSITTSQSQDVRLRSHREKSSSRSSSNSELLNKNRRRKTTYYMCPNFIGGIGNKLFIFATNFGAALSKGMKIAMSNQTELYRIFNLNVFTENVPKICKNVGAKSARWDCAFDEQLFKFKASKNMRLDIYIQSWKYFHGYEEILRKELVFRQHVQLEADEMLNKELNNLNLTSRNGFVLVGVHIRRGDMVNNSFGYNVATPEYLSKAVQYYKNKYKNTIFIVSCQDMIWGKQHFPKNTTRRFIQHHKREVIIALLSSCDHTITTVGTFGWWVGWLTGGDVTYFKWPAREGSELRKHYSKDYSDYYYPKWIGF